MKRTALLALVPLLAACGGSPAASQPSPTASNIAPAPARPDLLAVANQPLTSDLMTRLRAVTGVTALTFVSYGKVIVFDSPVDAAAVDVPEFRRFAPASSASATSLWTALSKGDVAVSHATANRLRLPIHAMVPAAGTAVTIAGIATTVPGIDLLADRATGTRLGLGPANAVIVSSVSPPLVAKAITKLLGPGATLRPILPSAQQGGAVLPSIPPVPPGRV